MKRKNYPVRILVAASLCAAFAMPAYAGLTAGTKYEFSSDYRLLDASCQAYLLGGDFEFEVAAANPYNAQLSNFVVSSGDNLMVHNNGDGSYELPQFALMSQQLAFSNAEGLYPFGDPEIYVTFTTDDEGNITMPDFSVVRYDMAAGAATVVASYSNVVITVAGSDGPGGGGDTPQFSAVGTHEFNWYKTDYSNPEAPVTTQETMTLVINENNQYTQIGGYTVSETLIEYGYDQGISGSDSWTVDLVAPYNVIEIDFATQAGIYVFGPEVDDIEEGPRPNGHLELSYKDEVYYLSDFTIWSKTFKTVEGATDEEGNVSSETETVWTLLCKWSSEGEVTEKPDTSGASTVEIEEGETRYFNLQGVEVKNPAKGEIMIKVSNGKSSKELLR